MTTFGKEQPNQSLLRFLLQANIWGAGGNTRLTSIRIRLFGSAAIETDERQIQRFWSNRIPALLGYLALQNGQVSRERVADALWEDKSEGALHNLRQTLLYVKQLTGQEIVEAHRKTLTLSSTVETDLRVFTRFGELADEGALRYEEAEACVDLYTGSFLQDLEDSWLDQPRAQLADRYLSALLYLATEDAVRNPARALHFIDKAIREDPYRDSSRALKIQILRSMGEEASAQLEFEAFAEFLEDELALTPSESVRRALDGAVRAAAPPKQDKAQFSAEWVRAVQELSSGNRPYQAVELCISLVPVWILGGTARAGLSQFAEALMACGGRLSDQTRELAAVAQARLQMASGDVVVARMGLETALPSLKTPLARVQALLTLTSLQTRRFNPKCARPLIDQATELAKQEALLPEVADALRLSAIVAFHEEDITSSERLALEAAQASANLGDAASQADAYFSIALARQRSGNTEGAQEALSELDRLLPLTKAPISTQIRVAKSRLLEEMGDLSGAEEGYRFGVQIARQEGDAFAMAVNLTYLGDFLANTEHLLQAIDAHQEALELRRKLGETLGTATSLRGLGKCYLLLGELGRARSAYSDSARLFSDEQALPGHASAVFGMAKVEMEAGNVGLGHRLAYRAYHLLLGLSSLERMAIGPTGDQILEEARSLALANELRHRA